MKLLRWSILLFMVFFLNIFIPGHIRGAITVNNGPDDCCAPQAKKIEKADSCCAMPGKHDEKKAPTEEQKRRCAVCYLVKGYSFPAVFTFDLQLSGNSHERFAEYASQIRETEFSFPYFPAGPPAIDLIA